MVDFQSRETTDGTTDDAADETAESVGEGESNPDGNGEQSNDEDHDHEHHTPAEDSHHAHDKSELGVGIVTVTSSRSLDADPSGDAIEAAIEAAGHTVETRELVGDSRDGIQSIVDTLVDRGDVDLVITTGGTGVSPDDVTIEALRPIFEKDLPGFGEVFRSLSYEDIGTMVVGTRATAGIANGVPIFALPGSEDAVTLATEEVIVPEAGHLAGLATRGRDEDEE